ncbi:hypothetical protein [Mycolicibacterium fortuitum]|uniref:Uncharacterized protein n=2 Tax=Mycolicibacterium fortuitum TaxID=1766 RepID=A0AAE5AFR4_MYCFO|nr:hypothetical protein [Mycolicibacterium fortuitum]MCV7139200.1 hypothetical protein [Mycolicibacterium fortuitum]MDV7194952.1 hypothetical protein [Mycolicibacterium fortuitum]MDV7208566.1 hypothetical protein [Mycolicibacterium fortuitum]MDV7230493.1 hypothetical protein [Mycolicibacterium fortuitum]MDV7262107.1 hypothetical protein [Mycolicibacterium fortuitum]
MTNPKLAGIRGALVKYGRSDTEWDELLDAATDYLIEVAKSRSLTNYSDLSAELVNRTGYARFDYNLDRDQAAVGALLGEVTDGTLDDSATMLSALVVQKTTGDPGEGFYRFARKLGLLRPGVEKLEFFQAQVARVHEKYKG